MVITTFALTCTLTNIIYHVIVLLLLLLLLLLLVLLMHTYTYIISMIFVF